MEYSFASTSQTGGQASAVREILKLTQGNSIISLAGGLPAEELFPVEALQQAFARVFASGGKALQYGLTEGYTPLREQIGHRLAQKGMAANLENILLTTGSQQAIDLLARVFIDPGDVILVENPTYLAALQIFQYYKAQVVAVNSDSLGMDMDDLLTKIKRHRPKLVYITPTFSNPTGKVWSVERRQALLNLCRKHNVVIVEDDPYGELSFHPDEHVPSIYSMDQHPDGSIVVYTSTVSKTVVPALRSGWVIGDRRIISALVRAKQAADLHSSSLDQQALYQLFTHFDIDAHIEKIRREYKGRMQLMTGLLAKQQWDDIHWNQPKGGMFLWVELPVSINAEMLFQEAVREGVSFVPGTEFYVGAPRLNTLRLNFSHPSPEELTIGIERLARAVNNCLQTVS
ncbi:PLP-dependent aminotransferase family protein [Laceyella putida]|uniref:PLP-dependent aminotransferase family protein n=1 Tax=Laceyella putida TaxID=110101 RepID=A0ABW2RFP9_9BACL